MQPEQILGKKVLISGGLGFIGSNTARRLVDNGAQVTVVDNHLPGQGANDDNLEGYWNRIQYFPWDVRSPEFLVLLNDVDIYLNFAAQTSHMGSLRDPIVDVDINARSQLSMLEYCRHNNPDIRIIFTSTRQVYGKPKYLPVDESHPLEPIDIHAVDKMAAEGYFRLYHDLFGIKATILRLTNTYGPRMAIGNPRLTFLGIWIDSLLKSKAIEVWDRDILRDFTHIDDVLDAFIAVIAEDRTIGGIFNLGGERIHLQDLAQLLARLYGKGEVISCPYPADRRKIEVGSIYSSFNNLTQTTGWKPKYTLEDGLKQTLDYYRLLKNTGRRSTGDHQRAD